VENDHVPCSRRCSHAVQNVSFWTAAFSQRFVFLFFFFAYSSLSPIVPEQYFSPRQGQISLVHSRDSSWLACTMGRMAKQQPQKAFHTMGDTRIALHVMQPLHVIPSEDRFSHPIWTPQISPRASTLISHKKHQLPINISLFLLHTAFACLLSFPIFI
jgi:hypothetical protein